MKGMSVALAAAAMLGLTACAAEDAPEAPAAPAEAAPGLKAAPSPTLTEGRPAAPRAPAYAVMPADGRADQPAVLADGPEGPGGMVTYVSSLGPDAVVDFHRGHAEAAGLATVMTMTQGEARAYGAASQDGSGAGIQVVASPVADPGGQTETSVTLTWTAGD